MSSIDQNDQVRRSQDSTMLRKKRQSTALSNEKDRKSAMSNYKKGPESIQEFQIEDESSLRMPKEFTKNFFQLAHTFPDMNIASRDMAETNGISAADRVLDEILTRGSKHLYEQYIVPKILPYTASTITQTFASLVNYVKIAKDQETADKAKFSEQWEDEGEPLPPKATLWMGDRMQVRQKPPPVVIKADVMSIISPRNKKKFTSKASSGIHQRKDGIVNIGSLASSPSPILPDLQSLDKTTTAKQRQRMMKKMNTFVNPSNQKLGDLKGKDQMAQTYMSNVSAGSLQIKMQSQTFGAKMPKNSPRTRKSPKTRQSMSSIRAKEEKKETKPEKLVPPPRPAPLETEYDLRKYLLRKQEKKEEEIRMQQEKDDAMAVQMKELQKKNGQNTSSRKGAYEEHYYRKLTNGELSFDTAGKPMLVKRINTGRLPKMLAYSSAGVDGVLVSEVPEEEQDIEESRMAREQKIRYSTMSDFNSQPPKEKPIVRVRPVTANINSKKTVIKQQISTIKAENAKIKANMEQIEQKLENEIEMTQEALERAGDPIESGGLYSGIDDVASNVTYKTGEQKKVGKRSFMEGRLSLHEYEALSFVQDRRSDFGVKMDNFETGGHEMMAILERDGCAEEQSIESVHLSMKTGKIKSHRAGSPGRVLKAHGTDNVIKEMFETQPMTLAATESQGFMLLKQQVNKRYGSKPSRLWSAVARTDPVQTDQFPTSRLGSNHQQQVSSNKKFHMTTTSHGNFFFGSSQVRNSYDKVISYDTTSLVDGIGEEKENNKHGRNNSKVQTQATVIPKLKSRPITSGQLTAASQGTHSVNEKFNQKLIQHGTANGVPMSDLPPPSTVYSTTQTWHKQTLTGSRMKRNSQIRTQKDQWQQQAQALVKNDNYASSYHLTQRAAQRPPSGRVNLKKVNMSSNFVTASGAATTTHLELSKQGGKEQQSPRNPRRRLISARYGVRMAQV